MKQTLALFILVMAVFTGCGQTQAAKDSQPNTETAASTTTDAAQPNSQHANQNSIMGKVTTMDGTKITLALAEKSSADTSSQGQPPKTDGAATGDKPADNPPSGNAPTKDTASADKSTSTPPSKDTKNRSAPDGAKPEMSFSDETQTITVTEDTVITTGMGDKAKSADISSVSVSTVLRVTLADDGTTAKNIEIMK